MLSESRRQNKFGLPTIEATNLQEIQNKNAEKLNGKVGGDTKVVAITLLAQLFVPLGKKATKEDVKKTSIEMNNGITEAVSKTLATYLKENETAQLSNYVVEGCATNLETLMERQETLDALLKLL